VSYDARLSEPFPGPNVWVVPRGLGEAATRCYRCGKLLWFTTVEVDRIVPGWRKTAKYPQGGTYVRENIRPACERCNKITGNEDRWKNHKPIWFASELLDLIRASLDGGAS
jgi:5-methylcytosine-specific restriction endonuclease McrA